MADPYVTATECRAAARRLTTITDDALIEAVVEEFEELAERYRGVAFTPRVATEVRSPDRYGMIELGQREVTAITSVTVVGGSVVTASAEIIDGPRGLISVGTVERVSVVFTYGLTAVPAALRAACIDYVDRVLAASESGTSRDVLSQSFDGGATRYSTPDWDAGRPTGWLDIDRRLNQLTDRRVRVF